MLVDAQPKPLAAVKVTTVLSKWPSQFGKELDKVYQLIRAGKVRKAGHNVMVYYPRGDGMVDIVCGVEAEKGFEEAGGVQYHETPSGSAATAVHVGSYDRMGSTHDAIVAWVRKNGYERTGVCWEIYGDWHDDPMKVRTDIFHLLQSQK